MTLALVDQAGVETLTVNQPHVLVTQAATETLTVNQPHVLVTQAATEVLLHNNLRTQLLVGQAVVETLTVNAAPHVLVDQAATEVLWAPPVAPAVSLTAQLLFSVSGVSGVANVVIAQGTTVSGAWSVSGGVSAYTYSWAFADLHGQSGFVSTAATSTIVRTYSVAGGSLGTRRVSSTVTDTAAASVTSAVLLHVGGVTVPSLWDGKVVLESQAKRRCWPL